MHIRKVLVLEVTMPRLPVIDEIEYLVRRRFPEIKAARYGGADSLRFVDAEGIIKEADAYENELQNLPREELMDRYQQELAKERAVQEEQANEKERRMFFNKPSAEADLSYWSKAAYWELDEAVALCFGKEPSIVNYKRVSPYSRESSFASEYTRLHELVMRANAALQLRERTNPWDFLMWANQIGISVPKELERKVRDLNDQLEEPQELVKKAEARHRELEAKTTTEIGALEDRMRDYEQRLLVARSEEQRLRQELIDIRENKSVPTLGTRERDSLLKIIIGMAVKGYTYDPSAARSSVPKEVASDLAQLGINLDVDTVRKWLRESADVLPDASSLSDET